MYLAADIWPGFWAFYSAILPPMVAICLVPPLLLGAAALAMPTWRTSARPLFAATLATTTTAVAAGYLAGASREGVMGDVLPVMLTGFGAVASFAVIQNKVRLEFAALIVFLFAICLFFGAIWGSYIRELLGAPIQTNTVDPNRFEGIS